MPKKLSPADERYLAWKKEKDSKVSGSTISDDDSSKSGKTSETINVDKGQAFILIKSAKDMQIAICPENEKQLKEVELIADKPLIVESIPGWTHDIKNIGNEELIVMLWANEVFDKENPDTFINEI